MIGSGSGKKAEMLTVQEKTKGGLSSRRLRGMGQSSSWEARLRLQSTDGGENGSRRGGVRGGDGGKTIVGEVVVENVGVEVMRINTGAVGVVGGDAGGVVCSRSEALNKGSGNQDVFDSSVGFWTGDEKRKGMAGSEMVVFSKLLSSCSTPLDLGSAALDDTSVVSIFW